MHSTRLGRLEIFSTSPPQNAPYYSHGLTGTFSLALTEDGCRFLEFLPSFTEIQYIEIDTLRIYTFIYVIFFIKESFGSIWLIPIPTPSVF